MTQDVTAQIQVGSRPMWGVGWRPTHTACLLQNSRPMWVLELTAYGRNVSELPDKESPAWPQEERMWVPASPEHILEDGILLIAIHVLRDEAVLDLANTLLPALVEDSSTELEKMPDKSLVALRELCRQIASDYKLVVTVLDGSSVGGQLQLLEPYTMMEIEVCTTSYRRFWGGPWGQPHEVSTSGQLRRPTSAIEPSSRPRSEARAFQRALENRGASSPEAVLRAVSGAGDYLAPAFHDLADAVGRANAGDPNAAAEADASRLKVEEALNLAEQLYYLVTGRGLWVSGGSPLEPRGR